MVHQILLEGLFYIHLHCSKNLNDVYMRDRLMKVGVAKLIDSAKRCAAFYAKGGAKVWADGMLTELNKGIRNKMYFT